MQTIYASLFLRVAPVNYQRERLELPDGDFLDFDWTESVPSAPVVVLFHGLEGSSSSVYARNLMRLVQARGWNGVVAHFRGTSGEDNRLPRAYYAGDSEEIERILLIMAHFVIYGIWIVTFFGLHPFSQHYSRAKIMKQFFLREEQSSGAGIIL